MKTSISLSLIFSFLILSGTYSFSTPLYGTYTIGSGGTYPSLNSAFNDVYAQGISGPVIFEVITGVYSDTLDITGIPGSSLINTFTLKSQTSNSSDVKINILSVRSSYISISGLSLGLDINIFGNYLNFTNNNFQDYSLSMDVPIGYRHDIYIIGNNNIGNLSFYGETFAAGGRIGNVQIKNNTLIGTIDFFCCTGIIENNVLAGNIFITDFSSCDIINNFMRGQIYCQYGNILNNTIIGGSITRPTLEIYGRNAFNNIVINPDGGTVLNLHSYYLPNSDYNDFYNGGNNNLIINDGLFYNNVTDFYNATGLDQHSNSVPVTFRSLTDLHLAGSSIGDLQLLGIPDTLVPDDIDGQIRSLTHPYKGADEADFPLPVELASFTSSVTNNNVKLNWTTVSELNNFGFDLERSIVNGLWSKVNFIKGYGNSTTAQNYSFEDKNLSSGKYNYRLKQIDFNGNFEYFDLQNEVEVGTPEKFSLSQNYPNPFNPSTVINYQLSSNSEVSLKIYDLSGKEVMTLVNGFKEAGNYEINFNGSNFASGIYYYKIIAGNFTSIKKMLLIK